MTWIYQLKIMLADTGVWRRVLVREGITFRNLHNILQTTMGWNDCHLHQFECNDQTITFPDDDCPAETKDERKTKLTRLAQQQRFTYLYDFGDGWDHRIIVEKILPDDSGAYPRCIGGACNCPPEDCGGAGGYVEMLEIIKNKKHPKYKSMIAWLGEKYDPQAFDLEKINNHLAPKSNGRKGWTMKPEQKSKRIAKRDLLKMRK